MRGDRGAGSFDQIASTYDAWYETRLGQLVHRLEKEAVFTLVEPRPSDMALDVSCGTGSYALELAERGLFFRCSAVAGCSILRGGRD
ncbi:MAG: class I SAM-dependent methyltransferase [Candidatus Methylomirabilia bacterium]